MSASPRSATKVQQARVFLLAVAIAITGYLLTYRARIESGDTLRALDALTSLSRYGDALMDESTWFKPPLRIRESTDWPLSEFDVDERMQLRLALPLLKLAENLPRLGNIHVVWLFNVVFAGLSAGLVYLLLRGLAYSDGVALLVAFSTAFATNLWAYSQTFFREPLAGFFLLLALYLLQAVRRSPISLRLLGSAGGLAVWYLAFLTKTSAIFALPAIAIFAVPTIEPLKTWFIERVSIPLLVASLLLLFAIMYFEPLVETAQNLAPGIFQSSEYATVALRAYLLSPGGSLWATSPLLLLAISGAVLLLRRGEQRLLWTLVVLVLGYSVMHALTAGEHWFGGLSWPPRFLMPIIPVAMLATAPVARKILSQGSRWLTLVWIALLLYGGWIQFSAVSSDLKHYGESLPPESMALSEWEPGLTEPRYFRWVVLPQRWGDLGLDFLWVRAEEPSWFFSFAVYGMVLVLLLRSVIRRPNSRIARFAPVAGILLFPLLYANLSAVYEKDPVTRSQEPALHSVLQRLAQIASEDDALLLPANIYGDFILNHLDGRSPRPIILALSPAQAASDKQPALLRSANPKDWFDISSLRALHHLAGKRDRVFLLANTSPFMPWSFRPYERYLALHYYPLGELELEVRDDRVRLLEYSTGHVAPNPISLYAGEVATDLAFGESIRLRAFNLPGGTRYLAGETLALSLLWQTSEKLRQDYTVAWFVVDSRTGIPVVQGHDSGPQSGFAPTSGWTPAAPVWDNRALRLPTSMKAGEHQIWVVLYRYDPATAQIRRLPVSGAQVAEEGSVGVLPITITVE